MIPMPVSTPTPRRDLGSEDGALFGAAQIGVTGSGAVQDRPVGRTAAAAADGPVAP